MLVEVNWSPEMSRAPRGRDAVTGLRDQVCFAQDLPLAPAAAVAVVHVRGASDRRMRRVAARLARVKGFRYATGPDTLAIIAPGVGTLELCRQLRAARMRRCVAGVAAIEAGSNGVETAMSAVAAMQRADAARLPVAV